MKLHEERGPGASRSMAPSWSPFWLDGRAAVVVCALIHAALFLWLFKATSLYYETGSDTQHVYWPAVQQLLAGHVPYRDPHFFVEYPPLGTAVFLLPALLHPLSLRAYDWLFAAEMVLADGVLLVLLALLARRLYLSVVGTVLAYSLLMPLLGAVVCQRYDIVPAALVLAALWALLRGRSRWAWLMLLIATLTKLYPVALAPLFLLYEWRRGRRAGAVLYVLGLAIFVVAWYALAPASLQRFLLWETRRGLEIESVFGSAVVFLHMMGLPAHIVPPSVFGSYDVASALTPALESLSTVLTVAFLGAIYFSYARHIFVPAHALEPVHGTYADPTPGPEQSPASEARLLVTHAALAVLGLLLCSKLLSIQFLLWMLPLLVLQPRFRLRVAALAFVAMLLSQWAFPFHWNQLWAFQALPVLIMAGRNGLLVALFVLLWRQREGFH